MIRDIPVKSVIIVSILFSGLIPLLITLLLTYSHAKNELKEQAFRHLESVRDIKKNHIEFLSQDSEKPLSQETINYIMNERSGMGQSGETYIVSSSFRMKSDSYLDPENRSVEASARGSVEKHGADTPAVRRALSGITGIDVLPDYRSLPVLSAYAPLLSNRGL